MNSLDDFVKAVKGDCGGLRLHVTCWRCKASCFTEIGGSDK